MRTRLKSRPSRPSIAARTPGSSVPPGLSTTASTLAGRTAERPGRAPFRWRKRRGHGAGAASFRCARENTLGRRLGERLELRAHAVDLSAREHVRERRVEVLDPRRPAGGGLALPPRPPHLARRRAGGGPPAVPRRGAPA